MIILEGPPTNNSGFYKQIQNNLDVLQIRIRRRFSIRIHNTDRTCRAEGGRQKSSAAFKAVLALFLPSSLHCLHILPPKILPILIPNPDLDGWRAIDILELWTEGEPGAGVRIATARLRSPAQQQQQQQHQRDAERCAGGPP
jgi:hypothetical protein